MLLKYSDSSPFKLGQRTSCHVWMPGEAGDTGRECLRIFRPITPSDMQKHEAAGRGFTVVDQSITKTLAPHPNQEEGHFQVTRQAHLDCPPKRGPPMRVKHLLSQFRDSRARRRLCPRKPGSRTCTEHVQGAQDNL